MALSHQPIIVEGDRLPVIAEHSVRLRLVPSEGLCADDSFLATTVSVTVVAGVKAGMVGVGNGKHKIVIIRAAPTPVEVEKAVAVVAVNHERMAGGTAGSAIQHRPPLRQLLVDNAFPDIRRVVITIQPLGVLTVVEHIYQRVPETAAGARSVRTIVHVHDLSAVTHQL